MHERTTETAIDVKQLQRCMNDLVSLLALPPVLRNSEPSRMLNTFLDALMAMLDLDFLFVRVRVDPHETAIDAFKTTKPYATNHQQKIWQALNEWSGEDPQRWSQQTFDRFGEADASVIPIRMGMEGELGLIVAGSRRPGFPEPTDSLVLSVAANQAAIGLQQAQLLIEQKRVARELDQRVAERTRELAEINNQLQLQVGLLQHLPVSAWTLKPDGTPEFVNQVWLEFSGQTLEFVRSHPEAWMTAIHPDDREKALKAFWDGVRSGQGFAFETRTLRARDGVYRWHLQQTVVLRDAEGRVIKFVGTTTDIDDQKHAEEALRASESNLRQIIDTIPTLSWCNLPDGPNEFLSKGWHQFTGLSPEEAQGWGWQVAFHPEDLPILMKKWRELIATGEPGELEARLRRHDGAYRWFLIRTEPFRNEAGTIIRWYGTSTDIDDRKRAEDELKRSEARYRVVIETASDAVVSIDESGTIVFANPATKRVFGFAPEELVGKPLTVLMPEGMRNLHEKGFKRFLETGERHLNWQGTEVTARQASGADFPAEVSFGEMAADHGKVFTGFIRDISEKKVAEESAKTNQRNLSLIINSMPVLAWSAQPDGSADFFNQRWLDYTGLAPAAALGWGWSSAFHRDEIDTVNEYWRSRIASGEPGEIEARLRHWDGSYRWFLFRANPLRDESGNIVKWYGTNVDIEDRKMSEEALRESEGRFRLIVDGIAGLVAIMSPKGELEVVNRQVLTYFGKSVEELQGWSTSNAVHPDDLLAVISAWTNSVETASVYDIDHRLLGADGKYRWFHARGLPLCDIEGRVLRWYVLLTDINDRKRVEEALARARADLAHVNSVASLGVLTASIAHEVSQPLSGIVTNTNTCLRMLNSNPPNIDGARETARRAIRDGNRASEVVTGLRALFRRKEITEESFDLNDAAREVIALSLSELQSNRIVIRHDFAENLPALKGDRIQIQQVILNLLRNASDAMRDIDNRPRQLLVKTENDGFQNVQLTVQDTGIGFAPDAADQLFESFYTTKDGGMGIGLSVSRSIIEAHNGRLWARANEDHGATFAFAIPWSDNDS